MKKLLFATAIAASAAAFATDPFNAISFESYTPGATFANGGTENNEFAKTASEKYFYFDGDSNSSVVTNESPVPAAATRPKWFADNSGTGNANYLALDTEGGTFWRSINDIASETTGEGSEATTTYGLGAAQAVGDGIYLDTMVQFTVTEDEEPTVGNGDKLAIWLQAGEGTTNLMVKAAVVGGGARTATDFVLNANVDPGIWYRLTVKAVSDITDGDNVAGFQIYLDGNLLTSDTITVTSSYLADLEDFDDSHYADIAAGKYFASLLAANTLQGVGFQGTGAIDDLVLTEEDPFAGVVTTIDFTLTLGANVAGAAVTYTVDGGEAQTPTFTEGVAAIPAGASVSVAEPTFAEGYELASFTVDGTAVASPTFPYVFTASVDTTIEITASQIPETYPTYINTSDTTIKAKYDAWKSTYQADTASQWESAFLLNMDPTASVAEGTALLKIASITEVSGGWELEIVSDATTLTATDGSVQVGNGYLRIIAADTLAGLTNATPSYIPVSVTSGKITVTVPAAKGKFMKAELTTEAPANN